MNRVTINEIARRSGVSKGAVSYALNNRPGVSAETRARILAVADQLGWAPEPDGPAAVGLADRHLRPGPGPRPPDAGQRALLHGVRRRPGVGAEHPLLRAAAAGVRPTSTASWRPTASGPPSAGSTRWSSSTSASTTPGSCRCWPRWSCPPSSSATRASPPPSPPSGPTTPRRWTPRSPTSSALGHRRIARVSGLDDLSHVQIRDRAFLAAVRRARGASARSHSPTSPPRRAGRRRARCCRPTGAPTAIMFDNDLMAVAALSALAELGVAVPRR